jgi:vancomycin resistance protein YoaR
MTTQQQAALQKAEDARLLALAKAGESERALAEQRTTYEQRVTEANTKYASLEQTLFSADKNATLASSLSGVTFAGETPEDKAETARQLRAILEPQFDTSRDASGAIITREKGTGRPAADVLKEALASKRFAHFFAAQSRGGSGTDGTRPAATTQPIVQSNLEAVAADYKARLGQFGSFGLQPLGPRK